MGSKPKAPLFAVIGVLLLTLLGILATAWYFFSPLMGAKLGLIDDHEIIVFLGTDHLLPLLEIPSKLLETEVGKWGELTRLRPVYYLLRLFETSIYSDHAGQWYLARILILCALALSASALFLFWGRKLKLINSWKSPILWLSIVPAIWMMTLPAWSDIVLRLGPSEIYLSAGIVTFVAAATWLSSSKNSITALILLGISVLVITGSKENGLIFLGLFFVICLLVRVRFSSTVFIVTSAVLLIWSVWIASGIGIAMFSKGGDVYGQQRGIIGFVKVLLGSSGLSFILISLVLVLLVWGTKNTKTLPELTKATLLQRMRSWWPVTLTLIGLTVFLWEAFFYQNSYNQGRYAVVSELAVLFIGCIDLIVIGIFLQMQSKRNVIGALLFVTILLQVPISGQVVSAVKDMRDLSKGVASNTIATQEQIAQAVEVINSSPGMPVRIVVNELSDYERAFSVPQYIKYFSGTNTFYLDVEIPDSLYESYDPAGKALVDRLHEWSVNGNPEWLIIGNSNNQDVPAGPCIYFTGNVEKLAKCSTSASVG